MPRVLALAVLALALMLPASATAATRYAAPGGGTEPGCAAATPCSLEYAITAAAPGDEIVVGPGLYELTETIETEAPLWIHGPLGDEKPQIVAAEKSAFKSFAPQRISDLEFSSFNTSSAVIFAPADDTVFERLKILTSGNEPLGLRPGTDFSLVDSVVFAEGPEAVGVFIQGSASGTTQLRNDTIVAEGEEARGLAVYVVHPTASIDVEAVNTIASGSHLDVSAGKSPEASDADLTVHFDHSNLDATDGEVTSTNGQTAPPQFFPLNPRGFQQAPTSPTIDAGVNDVLNGPIALNGSPRAVDFHPSCTEPDVAITDIGAYELTPVPLHCVPQTKIVKFKLRGRRAKLRFTATGTKEAVSFRCKLDRRRWRPCASPRVYKHLKPRRHTIKVRAFTATALDPTPAKRKFRVKPKHRRQHGRHHR